MKVHVNLVAQWSPFVLTAFVHFDDEVRRFRRERLPTLQDGHAVEIRRAFVAVDDFHFLAFGKARRGRGLAAHADITDDAIT